MSTLIQCAFFEPSIDKIWIRFFFGVLRSLYKLCADKLVASVNIHCRYVTFIHLGSLKHGNENKNTVCFLFCFVRIDTLHRHTVRKFVKRWKRIQMATNVHYISKIRNAPVVWLNRVECAYVCVYLWKLVEMWCDFWAHEEKNKLNKWNE